MSVVRDPDSVKPAPAPVPCDELVEVLDRERARVIRAACGSIRRSRNRYETDAPGEVTRRVQMLYDELHDAAATRDLRGVVDYARELAAERFAAGYDLSEVQVAVNAVEEAVWAVLSAQLNPRQLAGPLVIVSTVFGAAKDALALEYVFLASRRHAPCLDVSALFAGDAAA